MEKINVRIVYKDPWIRIGYRVKYVSIFEADAFSSVSVRLENSIGTYIV